MKDMNKRSPTQREQLLIKTLGKNKNTANEVIKKIFKRDLKKGEEFVLNNRGWKFYVHLNKCFAPMERKGLIKMTGNKIGETNKLEKVWSLK